MTTSSDTKSNFYERVAHVQQLFLSRESPQALELLKELQEEAPNAAEVYFLLGIGSAVMDELGHAIDYFERAHRRDPDRLEYSEILANLHARVGNLTESLFYAKLSTALEPHPHLQNMIPKDLSNYFESLLSAAPPRNYLRGFAKFRSHLFNDAITEFERQVSIKPDDGKAYRNLAFSYLSLGHFDNALKAIKKAVDLLPAEALTHLRAAQVSIRIGEVKAAAYHCDKVASCADVTLETAVAARAIFGALEIEGVNASKTLDDRIDALLAELSPLPEEAQYEPVKDGKIRIGYLVNGLWKSEQIALLKPILDFHDRDKFDVTLYQQTEGTNPAVQQLANFADIETKFAALDDEMAAIVIAGDQLDILVNCCTADATNRASLIAQQPCTIQIGLHSANEGLKQPGITHVITDPYSEEAMAGGIGANQELHSLGPGLWPQEPLQLLPEIQEPAFERNESKITLGAILDLEDLTEWAAEIYVSVLNALPEARLLLGATISPQDPFKVKRIYELFGDTKVASRISVWEGNTGSDAGIPDMAYWREIDLMMVAGRCSDQARVVEALWSNIPVVALRGKSTRASIAASILASATKPEWIADDADKFIQIISNLAGNLDELASLRSSLRSQLSSTALLNPLVKVRELERIYSDLVAAHQAG